MSGPTGHILLPQSSRVPSAFRKLLDFLNQLDSAKLPYRISHFREETIAVELAVPGQRWEVEFYDDGTVEVERFTSDGHVSSDESLLSQLFTTYSD